MNTWTGLLWVTSRPTDDGRRIMPGALSRPDEVAPVLRVRSEPEGVLADFGGYAYVGKVDQMIERSGVGFGIGTVDGLDPGIYRVAVDLRDVISEIGDEGADVVMTVTSGTLGAVTILAPDQPSAWPECEILVHRS